MKLYCTTGETTELPPKVTSKWSGSLSDASKARVALKKEGLKGVGTAEVEVLTNKTGLLEFLNSSGATA